MNRILLLTAAVLSIGCNNKLNIDNEKAYSSKVTYGFSHPESVVQWSDSLLFVSNIGPERGTEIHDGFISVVWINGQIKDSILIDGLDDPKGQYFDKKQNRLFVSDINKVWEVELGTKAKKAIIADSAEFLNDITMDAEGHIYVSDMFRSSIYKSIESDTGIIIKEWLKGEELACPNGLLYDNGKIIMASWGQITGSKAKEARASELKALEINSETIFNLSKSAIGNLDGIQRNGNEYLVTDWVNGGVFGIDSLGNHYEIMATEKSVGDFLYIENKGLLILPMNHQNRVDFVYLHQEIPNYK
jgi:sugar lactone lactonase YvrE